VNTSTKSAPSETVILAEAVAVAVEAPVDTAEVPSVEVTRCSEVDFPLAAVSGFAVATFERPSWFCSTSPLATATRSSRN
jgi:hypothetical protein